MNRSERKRRALAKTIADRALREPEVAPTLWRDTGELARTAGVLRPRVVVAPELFDAPLAVRRFVLYHELAHVILRHGLVLAVATVLARMLVLLGVFVAGVAASGGAVVPSAMLAVAAALLEGRFGLLTLHIREEFERQADAAALTIVGTSQFAHAVAAMPRQVSHGWPGKVAERLYGKTWKDRCARVGVYVA